MVGKIKQKNDYLKRYMIRKRLHIITLKEDIKNVLMKKIKIAKKKLKKMPIKQLFFLKMQ